MPVLTTDRLILREITIADADYILAQLNDPGWLQNIGDRNIHTLEKAKEYIEVKILSSVKANKGAFFVVIRKDDQQESIIGQCGIFKRDGLQHHDLGFAFLEQFCGQGYGYEAAREVVDYTFDILKIKKLVAITSDDNIASQGLLRKLGMTHTSDRLLPNIVGNNKVYEFL